MYYENLTNICRYLTHKLNDLFITIVPDNFF